VEVQSQSPIWWGLRPVAYADIQLHQQKTSLATNWATNISLRTGFQLEHVRVLDRTVQLLLEYYRGRSPNGQFYALNIETVGLGLHIYF
jgi:hypothetical protein